MAIDNSANPQGSVKAAAIRNRRLDYAPLKEFGSKSCNVFDIQIPSVIAGATYAVQHTDGTGTLQYHAKEIQQIVRIKVAYIPLANKEGMQLIPLAKKLVEDVLKDDYEAKTAIIMHTGKDAKKSTVDRNIEQCVITGVDIAIDIKDYVRITFHLEGVMAVANE